MLHKFKSLGNEEQFKNGGVIMKKRMRVFFMFFSIALLLGPLMVNAQSTGTLKGKVMDAVEKFPLPTVKVTVVGKRLFGSTNSEGEYTIPGLAPGTYKITFEMAGYVKKTRTDVAINAGETTTLDVSMRMGFSHETTVTASRQITSLQRVPLNVEVLTATEMEDAPTLDIVQALNQVSGVDVFTGSGMTTAGTFISINGYDDVYIKKMIDGVDVTEIMGNWSMLNAYPAEMVAQIEVIKGGSSSLWGANMGGVINVITKRPQELERPIFTLKGSFSSYNAMDFGMASATGQSGQLLDLSASAVGTVGKLGYLLGYKNQNYDGFTLGGKNKNYNIFGKLFYDIGDATKVDLLYSYNHQYMKQHMWIESWRDTPPGYDYYWNYFDDGKLSTQVFSARVVSRVSPGLDLEAQLKYTASDNYWVRTGGESSYGDTLGAETIWDLTESRYGFTVKGNYNPSEAFSLVAGLDYYRTMADYTKYIADQPLIYVNQWAPFANMEYRIGNLGIHLGVRYDDDSSFGSQLSPSVGINWNFTNRSLVRMNIGRTFKVPDLWYTIGEAFYDMILPNPNLLPERAWAYSIGFESQELKYVWAKVSLYYHNMTDGIIYESIPDNPGRYTWANATKFIRKGYEAELGVLTPWGISGFISTNYNDHTNVETETVLYWIPARTYKSRLQYKNDKWDLTAHLQGRWVWWNMMPWELTFFYPHDKRWVFDIRVSKGFQIAEHVKLDLILDLFNLTNQLYWDRLDSPNPRRWWKLGFGLTF